MTDPAFDAVANRLGALALRLADRMQDAVTARGARSPSAATVLSVIERFFVSPPSVDELRRVLGLTSSGVVRLVDALEADGLVTRGRGSDGRVTVVALTRDGRRQARAVTDTRADVLTDALGVLSADERAMFGGLVDRMLEGLLRGPRPAPAMCRLCATEVCGATRGKPCPVVVAALGLDVG